MAYVVPNNRVVIYKNIPLERNYERSLYFANETAQAAFFPVTTQGNSKVKYVFSDMTHIRVTTPGRKIRVPININDLYDCNYLGITNYASGGHTTKTFYCFIDNVEYVNENLSEISYSIDVIQTWLFQFITGSTGELKNMCFVEREHVKDDTRGLNILDENLNCGDMINGLVYSDPHFADPRIVLIESGMINSVGALVAPTGWFYNGTYHQIDIKAYQIDSEHISDTITSLRNEFNELSIFGNQNAVINLLMIPSAFVPSHEVVWATSMQNAHITSSNYINPSFTPTQGTYTPFNNKLLTYPYSFFTLENNEGTTQEFKYELFNSDNYNFDEYCDFSPEPSVLIVPVGYGQTDPATGETLEHDFSKALRFTNFPKCSWATNDLGAKFVQAGIGAIIGAMTKGVYVNIPGAHYEQKMPNIPPIINPLQIEQSKQMQVYQRPFVEIPQLDSYDIPSTKIGARLKPKGAIIAGAVARGLLTTNIDSFAGNGNILLPTGSMGFNFKQKYLRPEIAKVIDDYFSMYGYKVNALKKPSIKNREYWTYVKTNGCVIDGEIPNDDADAISDIFDNGITFWDVGNLPAGHFVGDYNQYVTQSSSYVNTPIL